MSTIISSSRTGRNPFFLACGFSLAIANLFLGGAAQRELSRIRKVAGSQVVEAITGVIFVPLTGAIRKEAR